MSPNFLQIKTVMWTDIKVVLWNKCISASVFLNIFSQLHTEISKYIFHLKNYCLSKINISEHSHYFQS